MFNRLSYSNSLVLLKKALIIIAAFPCFLSAQNDVQISAAQDFNKNEPKSNIIRFSAADTAVVKLEMVNAQYDNGKNFFPYYLISKRTDYNLTAIPTLIVKKVQKVTESASSVIKRFYSSYLKSDFYTEALSSLAGNSNLNQYKIHPFRLNFSGDIEELIDYEVSWSQKTNDHLSKMKSASAFKNNSVLVSGKWFKFSITKNGIYKIDRNLLISSGIDFTSFNPKNIRIYGNGGVMLPESNSAFRYDDLEENAIQVVGEEDGVFNDGDYILFYAKDNLKWKRSSGNGLKYNVENNLYSDKAYYYLTFDLGPGKRVNAQPSLSVPPFSTSNTYDYYNFHESNTTNFMKSGRQFFGEYYDVVNAYSFTFNEGNFIVGDSLICETSAAGRGATNTIFNVSGNGLNYNLTTFAVDVSNYLASYADVQTNMQKVQNNNGSSIGITVSKLTASSIGWLDKVTINARRALVADQQFNFRDSRVSTGTGKTAKYIISSPLGIANTIWNVTNPINPYAQYFDVGNGTIEFTAPSDSTMEYVVAPISTYFKPTFEGAVVNQNLHALQQADYIIVTHPLFVAQSQRLAALHSQNEGLTYAIATTEQIYNEFGSGMPDITAIRDFIRMVYSRNIASGKQPKYVLLFGDGSYDNKNRNLDQNSALIPTFQSPYSLSPLQSLATDDYFALMDANEGVSPESVGSLDIGVGRIVARTAAEADAVTAKIENYYKKETDFKIADPIPGNCTTAESSVFGDWKNWVIFLGDDEDYSTHMGDADKLAKKVKLNNPNFNLDKIYLDAYQQFSTPGGQRYPDALIDLERRLKKGALIFNYTGHGGEVGLTSERLVDLETINAWENINRLSLFVTATCEFTRYDDPGRISAGEYCLLNPKGGAMSLFTTCRLAFSHSNLMLNSALYDFMFRKLPNGKRPCLGDIIRRTKDTLNQSFNFSNFHLIGDPAITLAVPEQKVFTSSIKSKPVVPNGSDTLGALEKVTIKGFIADTLGNKLTNFNGLVYPTVFDKEATVSCLLNDLSSYYITPGLPFQFNLQKNILFRGKTEVKNGDFSFTFMVPKDISFAFGPGKISYYATNGIIDAVGSYTNVIVGGGSSNAFVDNTGPQIEIFLNEKGFVSGGTTNEKPILYASLNDSSGINTIGTSIGHDITAVIDGDASKPIILNDFYEANLNTYQAGRIRYPFEELKEGSHQLVFKAWDIQNNSSKVSLDFVVAPSAELALNHVLNYPNPFTSSTKFFLEHNQACNPIRVTVQVFSISGKLVKTLQRSITCEGFRPEGIEWDGKDDFGDKLARGVYIYKVAILNSDNKKAEKTEKLVILN